MTEQPAPLPTIGEHVVHPQSVDLTARSGPDGLSGEATMAGDGEKRRGRGRPKRRARNDVLRQVMEHYWRDGIKALSLNEVCRRVSASKPAIYREFGGEDGLQEAVLGHYRDLVVAPVLDFLAAERPFAEALEALIIGMTTPGESPAGCLFTEMRLLRDQLGPECIARLKAMEEERCSAFAQWYARALESGEANPALSPMEAAQYIDAQFTLLLLHMGTEQSPEAVRARARLAMGVLAPR